jgi:hypothetical protein
MAGEKSKIFFVPLSNALEEPRRRVKESKGSTELQRPG